MAIKKSIDSLKEQLNKQLKFLKNSADLFDKGDEDEAIRLATTLRVLLHDINKSQSLLYQLDLKDKLQFEDTGIYEDRLIEAQTNYFKKSGILKDGQTIPGIQISEIGLVVSGNNVKGEHSWIAPLDQIRFISTHPNFSALQKPQPFHIWWNKPLVQGKTRKFSRADLILIMANRDGGAHVYPNLDDEYNSYFDLTTDHLGVQWASGNHLFTTDESVWNNHQGNVAAASVRQITYEVITTIEKHLQTNTLA